MRPPFRLRIVSSTLLGTATQLERLHKTSLAQTHQSWGEPPVCWSEIRLRAVNFRRAAQSRFQLNAMATLLLTYMNRKVEYECI